MNSDSFISQSVQPFRVFVTGYCYIDIIIPVDCRDNISAKYICKEDSSQVFVRKQKIVAMKENLSITRNVFETVQVKIIE